MSLPLTEPTSNSIPIVVVHEETFSSWLSEQPETDQHWLNSCGLIPEKNNIRASICLFPDTTGHVKKVVWIKKDSEDFGLYASLAQNLPNGMFHFDSHLHPYQATLASFAWALSGYTFNRYKQKNHDIPNLVWPETADRHWVEAAVKATFLVRDLINTPANDMGPEELAAAAEQLAAEHHAKVSSIVGEDLLHKNYPLIYAVGKASSKAPRLIDLRWSPKSKKPVKKITLIGKGVCFDSGGLDIKPSSNMLYMKKDMGGAAHVLGLAQMIMSAQLPVTLRVLIPAVENSIAGNAMRPLDILKSRQGFTVEIGNTDAEGRLILADALSEACKEQPDMVIDCATLTGAARVALGTDVPALFCNNDTLATQLLDYAHQEQDPLWRMPLYQPYKKLLKSSIADLSNSPQSSYGGAIAAALFLEHFVTPSVPWIHLDMMAWNLSSSPGKPEGGEAMGLRALYRLVAESLA